MAGVPPLNLHKGKELSSGRDSNRSSSGSSHAHVCKTASLLLSPRDAETPTPPGTSPRPSPRLARLKSAMRSSTRRLFSRFGEARSEGGRSQARAPEPEPFLLPAESAECEESRYHLVDKLRLLRESEYGAHACVRTMLGIRRITYADYTASARPLKCIEDTITKYVFPTMANTHTEVSATGLQTTLFREEARLIIRECLHCGPDDHVIFTGSGSTAAMAKLRDLIGLTVPDWVEKVGDLELPEDARPCILVGPFEHHSNELMWRETVATVVVIGPDASGRTDLGELEQRLQEHRGRSLVMGSFCAGSNVTGILERVDDIARLLKQYGALAVFDYAGAGPYVDIDMNPPGAEKDAVFISPHKFPGGPQTPGILCAKSGLFRRKVPTIPGGGTVDVTTPTTQYYSKQPEVYEEAGTPGIVQSIRAGLVFKLKRDIGVDVIEDIEARLARRAIDRWSQNPNIQLMGAKYTGFFDERRMSILSFVITTPREVAERIGTPHNIVHHHFVCALLTDVFGIQSRSGCSCTGPLGFRLFEIEERSEFASKMIANSVDSGRQALKPGWTRVNFPVFASIEMVDFIIEAVDMVATHGWKLLPLYRMDVVSGRWISTYFDPTGFVKNLVNVDLFDAASGTENEFETLTEERDPAECYSEYLAEAQELFDNAAEIVGRVVVATANTVDAEPFNQCECRLQELKAGYLWPDEAARALGLLIPGMEQQGGCTIRSMADAVVIIVVVQRMMRSRFKTKRDALRARRRKRVIKTTRKYSLGGAM